MRAFRDLFRDESRLAVRRGRPLHGGPIGWHCIRDALAAYTDRTQQDETKTGGFGRSVIFGKWGRDSHGAENELSIDEIGLSLKHYPSGSSSHRHRARPSRVMRAQRFLGR
ncbi:hypothetical protein SAMN04487768_1483 [Burkholderia sp. b13]|nr:hypothetical protein SAMN04487768_1483 [Burkholderia sp. b13]